MKAAARLVAPLSLGTLLTIFVAAMLLAGYGRWLEPARPRPDVEFPEGFYGFWDQSQYLRNGLAEGRLPAIGCSYRLGYQGRALYLLGSAILSLRSTCSRSPRGGSAILGARFIDAAGLVAARWSPRARRAWL
jgi:hypothetical protein